MPLSAIRKDQRIADAMAEFFKKHRPAQRQEHLHFRPGSSGIKSQTSPGLPIRDISPDVEYDKKFIQIHDSFIVAQTDEGFVLIDQHALHERIIYEDLSRRIRNNKLQSQRLLMPESFELTDAQANILQKNAGLLEKLGIEIVPFAPRTMAIQSFPVILAKADPLDFIQDLIDLLESKTAGLDADRLLDEVLNMAACKAAIKAGQKLTTSEIEQLLADKATVDCSSRCPHGRPTTIEFSIKDLEKQFKRT
jgi:DNA mismatch repair protein MutL